jgi:hypothetical protein
MMADSSLWGSMMVDKDEVFGKILVCSQQLEYYMFVYYCFW